jgi:hypothetical protein
MQVSKNLEGDLEIFCGRVPDTIHRKIEEKYGKPSNRAGNPAEIQSLQIYEQYLSDG